MFVGDLKKSEVEKHTKRRKLGSGGFSPGKNSGGGSCSSPPVSLLACSIDKKQTNQSISYTQQLSDYYLMKTNKYLYYYFKMSVSENVKLNNNIFIMNHIQYL